MESKNRDVIINAAIGSWYPKGQRRLVNSLIHHGYNGQIRTWLGFANDHFDISNKYNVKPAAFEEAMAEGFSHILWLDASVWAIKDPNPIFDIINEQGYYFWKNGYNCAQECSDKCLDYFKVTRDEAEKMPCVSTSMFGVNLQNPNGKMFIELWLQSARDKIFDGSRQHDNQSQDPRFLHHRQDQSPASIIANKMGLRIHEGNDISGYYHNNGNNIPASVIFLMRGM